MKRLARATPPDAVKATGLAVEKLHKEFSQIQFNDATIGIFHDACEKGMPVWYREAVAREQKDPAKTGYNFVGKTEYLSLAARLIFGDDIDLASLAMAPSYGGSHAIYLGNSVLQDIVPVGLPTWPNHPGLIENAGGIIVEYRALDDMGAFNLDGFLKSIEEYSAESESLRKHAHDILMMRWGVEPDSAAIVDCMHDVLATKKVAPLLHAICHNPLGVDVPKSQWEQIAEIMMRKDLTLQLDLAYIGFGKSPEEDVEFVRFLHRKGVKMFVYFSFSKFHAHYAERRAGAVLCANFSSQERSLIQEQLLQQIRNTTSAIATEAQSLSLRIENDEDIRIEQRKWVQMHREMSILNRQILNGGIPHDMQLSSHASGPFLFARDGKQPILPWIFPELAQMLGYEVPKKAFDFPKDCIRLACVPTPAADGLGFGGVRIGLPLLTEAKAIEAAKTLAYGYSRIM